MKLEDSTDIPKSGSRVFQLGNIEEVKRKKPFILSEFFYRRAPAIIGIGTPLFLLFSLILAPLVAPKYTASGSLLIQPGSQLTLKGYQREYITGDLSLFQRTLAKRVVNASILASALKSLNDDERPDFLRGLGDGELAIRILEMHLTVKEVERTYLVSVELEGSSKVGLAETLNAILNSLINEFQGEQKKQHGLSLDYLHSEKAKISEELETERQRLISLADQYHDTTFLRSNYQGDISKLELIQTEYFEAASDALAKEALLKKCKADKEKLSTISVIPFAEEKEIDNLGISSIESYNYAQSQELRATVDGLTPSNDDRKSVEARITAMRGFLADFKQSYKDATIKTLAGKQDILLDTEVIKASNAYASAQELADVLKERYTSATEEVGKVSAGIFEANDIEVSINQLRGRLALISGRLDDEELDASAPLPIVVNQFASTPLYATGSNIKKILLLALFASFGIEFGFLFLFDFFNDRIRSSKEFSASIGGAETPSLPALRMGNGEAKVFSRQIARNENSLAAKALRDLALRLILEIERSGSKIISFVGIHRRTGNTSIALGVGRQMAEHGLKVLITEFPTDHPGLSAAVGLERLEKSGPVWGNMIKDPMSSADLLPWIPGNSFNEVRSSMSSYLKSAAADYDVCLLDLVPISQSDISKEVVDKSDVVVLTAAQDVTRYEQLLKSIEWCKACRVPAISAILNFSSPIKSQVIFNNAEKIAIEKAKTIHRYLVATFLTGIIFIITKIRDSSISRKIIARLRRKPNSSNSENNIDN